MFLLTNLVILVLTKGNDAVPPQCATSAAAEHGDGGNAKPGTLTECPNASNGQSRACVWKRASKTDQWTTAANIEDVCAAEAKLNSKAEECASNVEYYCKTSDATGCKPGATAHDADEKCKNAAAPSGPSSPAKPQCATSAAAEHGGGGNAKPGTLKDCPNSTAGDACACVWKRESKTDQWTTAANIAEVCAAEAKLNSKAEECASKPGATAQDADEKCKNAAAPSGPSPAKPQCAISATADHAGGSAVKGTLMDCPGTSVGDRRACLWTRTTENDPWKTGTKIAEVCAPEAKLGGKEVKCESKLKFFCKTEGVTGCTPGKNASEADAQCKNGPSGKAAMLFASMWIIPLTTIALWFGDNQF